MFNALPLLALPVLLYNLVLLTLKGGVRTTEAAGQMGVTQFTIRMTSGGAWPVSIGDMLLASSLIVLFIELLKSTNSRNIAIINHSLSMLLFVLCLVEFLLWKGFATSAFFIITLMVLLDVLAGFIVTIVASRRDIDLHG